MFAIARSHGLAFRMTAFGVLLTFALAACTNASGKFGDGGQDGLTPKEQELRAQSESFETSDKDETVKGGVVIGAIAGAVLGGLAAALTGKGQFVAAGLAAGAALGGITGYYVAGKKEDYAQAESNLDLLIADTRAQNEQLVNLIATSVQVIVENKADLQRIRQAYSDGTGTVDDVNAQIARLQNNRNAIQLAAQNVGQRASRLQGNFEDYTKKEGKPPLGLQPEIDGFKRNRGKLDVLLASVDEFVGSLQLQEPTT
jgi:uncharacterized protein YcfJ